MAFHAESIPVFLKERADEIRQEGFGLLSRAACEIFRFHKRLKLFSRHIEGRVCGDAVKKVVFGTFFFDAFPAAMECCLIFS